MSFYVLKKINKMQVEGKNFWLVYILYQLSREVVLPE